MKNTMLGWIYMLHSTRPFRHAPRLLLPLFVIAGCLVLASSGRGGRRVLTLRRRSSYLDLSLVVAGAPLLDT
jgi:hypothetical protein